MNNLSIRKMNELTKKKKKGFTLVELIIVIAIIAILAAIAIPKFGSVRENSNKSADIANAKNISLAVSKAIAEDKIKYNPAITKVALNALPPSTGSTNYDITNQIDGIKSDTTLKTSAHNTETYTVSVSTDGNVSIFTSGTGTGATATAAVQIYPDTDTSFK